MTSLELHPENVDALYLLAFIYQGRRDYAESERLYEQALTLQRAKRHQERARHGLPSDRALVRRRGVLPRAHPCADLFDPGPRLQQPRLGAFNQGRVSEALEQFERAIEFQPELCLATTTAAWPRRPSAACAPRSSPSAPRSESARTTPSPATEEAPAGSSSATTTRWRTSTRATRRRRRAMSVGAALSTRANGMVEDPGATCEEWRVG